MAKPKAPSSSQIEYKKNRILNLRVEKNRIIFDLIDKRKSSSLMRIEWNGIKFPSGGVIPRQDFAKILTVDSAKVVDANALSVLITKGKTTKLLISRGSSKDDDGWSIKLNDQKASLNDAAVQRLIREMNEQSSEVFTSVASGGAKSLGTSAGQTEPIQPLPLSHHVSDQDRAMNTICLAAGAAVSIWPIGTMIAGPTFVGCLVWYATGAGGDGGDTGTGGGGAGPKKPPLAVYEPP